MSNDTKTEAAKIIDMYRVWCEGNGKPVPFNTLDAYKHSVATFVEWIRENGYSIASIDRVKFVDYCKYISVKQIFSASTKRHRIASLKSILKFLFDKGAIDEFELNTPIGVRTRVTVGTSTMSLIPVYSDIQKLRQKRIRLEDAMAFEFGLSSGLRISEMLSVRFCDIDFSRKPIDITTNKRSSCCGGTVTVSTIVASVKGKRTRVTFISPLASRLVRAYAKVNTVNLSSKIPLFLSPSRMETSMNAIRSLIQWDASKRKTASSKRTCGEVELNESFSNLPIPMQKAYAARIQREETATHIPDGIIETGNLTWHSLRHFFTALMLHRTYDGHRNAVERVMELLGHSSLTTTMHYLSKLTVVASDQEWVHTVNGTSSSWINVVAKRITTRRSRCLKD